MLIKVRNLLKGKGKRLDVPPHLELEIMKAIVFIEENGTAREGLDLWYGNIDGVFFNKLIDQVYAVLFIAHRISGNEELKEIATAYSNAAVQKDRDRRAGIRKQKAYARKAVGRTGYR